MMTMKNKLTNLYPLLLLVLCLGVTSCGNPTHKPSQTPSESESESIPPISESEPDTPTSEESTQTDYNQPNSEAKSVTIATLLSKGTSSDNYNLYRITGVVQFPYNYNYGNFDLVDSTGSISVYGLSKNASSMVKSSGQYSFSNDKTFTALGLKAGDTLTMEGIYSPYTYSSGYYKPEIKGYAISKVNGNVAKITGKNYTAKEPYSGTYYSSVSSLSGRDLLKGLHNLMMSTHKIYVSYSSLKTTLKSSDPGNSSGQVKCFYSGKSTSSFNREHVWAQSLSGVSSSNKLYGEDYGGADIHHIRPAISTYNSQRSNAAFGVVYGPKSGMNTIDHVSGQKNYITGSVIEPVDSIKGDVARIVMYMYMHYSQSVCNDAATYPGIVGTMNIYYIMGPNLNKDCFNLLREWNALDPVDDYERNRNEVGYSKQGNRNPFVDHPSYADAIWG